MIKNSRVKIVLWVVTAAIGLGLISCVLVPYLSYQSQLRQAYSLAYALGLSDKDLLKNNRHCSNLWGNCGPILTFETTLSLTEFEEQVKQQGAGRGGRASGFAFVNFSNYEGITLDGQSFYSAHPNSYFNQPRGEMWSIKDERLKYFIYFSELAEQPARLAYKGRFINCNVVSIFVRPIP
jgi:hypothetical protein